MDKLCEKYLNTRYGHNLSFETRIGTDDFGNIRIHKICSHNDKTIIHFAEYWNNFPTTVIAYNTVITDELETWCNVKGINSVEVLKLWCNKKFDYKI